MKNRLTSLLAIGIVASVALVASVPEAQSQTTTTASNTAPTIASGVVTNIPNFFNTAFNWMTAFNASYTWTNTTVQIEDGLVNENGVGAADYLRGQYNFNRWHLIAEGQFYGAGEAFNTIEGGGGYAFVQYEDLQVSGNVLAGGSKASSTSDAMKFRAEGEFKLDKKMTTNTYAAAALGVPYQEGQKFTGIPDFHVGLGCTF